MPNLASPKKELRKSKKRYQANLRVRRRLVEWRQKIQKLIDVKEKDKAVKAFSSYTKLVDKAVKNKVFHPNKAARYKSKFQKAINSI